MLQSMGRRVGHSLATEGKEASLDLNLMIEGIELGKHQFRVHADSPLQQRSGCGRMQKVAGRADQSWPAQMRNQSLLISLKMAWSLLHIRLSNSLSFPQLFEVLLYQI